MNNIISIRKSLNFSCSSFRYDTFFLLYSIVIRQFFKKKMLISKKHNKIISSGIRYIIGIYMENYDFLNK